MEVSKKERILIVAEKGREVYGGLISSLSNEFIVRELYAVSDPSKPPFLLVRWFLLINNWRKSLKKFRPDEVVICGGSLISVWIIIFLIRAFTLNIQVILFRYDIEYFWPKPKGLSASIKHFISLKLEKFCFVNSDKILHKGMRNELEHLPFYNKLKGKPAYLFREFLNKDLIQDYNSKIKLSKNDKEVHLVYVGGLYFEDLSSTESFWRFYPKITKQKIHLHIYSNQPVSVIKKFKKIEEKNPYFHYEGHKSHNKLVTELVKYDYGVHMFGGGASKKNDLVVAFSNKNYDYIAAGLPIIVSNDLKAVKEFVLENDLGLAVDYKDIFKIKNKLIKNKCNYRKSVKGFIKNFKGDRLIAFIKNDK